MGEKQLPVQVKVPSKTTPKLIGELSSIEGGAVSGKPCYQKLAKLFEMYRHKSHVVLIQGTPDPDAISSALTLEFLGNLFEVETTILSFSNLSHQENRALVKRLGINLIRYDEGLDLSRFNIYSIVDSQKTQTPITVRFQELGVEFFAFIDHHRDDGTPPPALFVDIRPNVASTAAIMCEYLKEALPKGLEPSDPNHIRVATALMHGIRSDTSRFLSATKIDYQGASFLAPCVDYKVINLIERQVLSPSVIGILQNALVNRRVFDNFILSDVGYVRPVDRDGIPQAAELLLNREGTDTVLIWGIVDEQTIDGSFRTLSETINPDEFLKGLLGVSPESGQYYGGGNIRDRGGFQIPLGFLCRFDDKDQIYDMARDVIETSFLNYIGKDKEIKTEHPPS